MTYQEWCQNNGCNHAHCPHECEHPQPLVMNDSRLICGKCYFIHNEITEMLACTPEVCNENQDY